MPRPESYALAQQLLASVADDAECATLAARLLARLNPHRHSIDFASITWNGKVYGFTPTQRRVVKMLWDAWEVGSPDVGQECLLDAAGSESDKLASIFKDSPAWGSLIRAGLTRGTFRLCDPPLS